MESCCRIIEKRYRDLNRVLDFVSDSDNFSAEELFYIEKHVREKLISNLNLGKSVIKTS